MIKINCHKCKSPIKNLGNLEQKDDFFIGFCYNKNCYYTIEFYKSDDIIDFYSFRITKNDVSYAIIGHLNSTIFAINSEEVCKTDFITFTEYNILPELDKMMNKFVKLRAFS